MKNPASVPGKCGKEFSFDTQSRKVTFGEKSQRLTRIEFRLLEHLVQRPGALVTRQELLESVWGAHVAVEVRTVDSHMVRLRRKLRVFGTQFFLIETVWGLGYRFQRVSKEEIMHEESVGI